MRDGAPGDIRTLHHLKALAALGNPDRARLMDALYRLWPRRAVMFIAGQMRDLLRNT